MTTKADKDDTNDAERRIIAQNRAWMLSTPLFDDDELDAILNTLNDVVAA
jgi:hypothetical protein